MKKFNLKINKGFTLLEALVAISILMVAVTAPITIAQKGLSSASYSKNQMVASYLAQDAIEYIKNKRDQISLNPDLGSSLQDIFSACFAGSTCQVDTVRNSGDIMGDIVPFSAEQPLLKGTEESSYAGFYQYLDGEPTNFVRKIVMVTSSDNSDEVLLTVTVSWGTQNDKVTVNTLIFNY